MIVTILLTILILILLVIAFLLYKNTTLGEKTDKDNPIHLIQQQMEGMKSQITQFLSDNQTILQKVNTDLTQTLQTVDKNVNSRLDKAAQVISDLHQKIGQVHETTKQVQEIGKDIASLQEILKAPKLRGGLGELFLSDLLKQVLPAASYKEQYRFKSGEKVDAVIILKGGLVPIDSKFPLENFKRIMAAKEEAPRKTAKKQFIRDVKKHIDSIHQKYILPDEGTFDFALMYIMAENVYYEIIIKDEDSDDEQGLLKYALENRVIPVSPNSFYAYLQTILLGLKGLRIEAQAQEIFTYLSRLEGDFEKVMNDFDTMGKHLKDVFNKYEDTEKRLGKFGDKLTSLDESKEPLSLPISK